MFISTHCVFRLFRESGQCYFSLAWSISSGLSIKAVFLHEDMVDVVGFVDHGSIRLIQIRSIVSVPSISAMLLDPDETNFIGFVNQGRVP